MTLEIDVLTLFPAMFDGPLAASIPGRIQEQGLATIRIHDLRDWGLGRHRSVDDAPYGGGAGMILRPEPVADALDALRRDGFDGDPARPDRRGLPPGAGRRPRHAIASHLRLPALRGRRRADPLAGRPRAVDRRLRPDRRRAAGARRHRCRHPPAARAPSRRPRRSRNRSPTACSSTRSTRGRPSSAAMDVPAILTSGDHGAVARWRREQAIERTRRRRPDLAPGD